MTKRHHRKLIHEVQYVAKLDIELVDTEDAWSPYLSLDDALKLDDIRNTLRRGDIETATQLADVFTLTPVAV